MEKQLQLERNKQLANRQMIEVDSAKTNKQNQNLLDEINLYKNSLKTER